MITKTLVFRSTNCCMCTVWNANYLFFLSDRLMYEVRCVDKADTYLPGYETTCYILLESLSITVRINDQLPFYIYISYQVVNLRSAHPPHEAIVGQWHCWSEPTSPQSAQLVSTVITAACYWNASKNTCDATVRWADPIKETNWIYINPIYDTFMLK